MSGQRTSARAWHAFREAFYQDGKRLDAAGDPAANCWLCLQRISYDVPPNTTPDSHNLDHYYPVSTHPELQHDPDNARHSHTACNQRRGNKAPGRGGLGEPVGAWW